MMGAVAAARVALSLIRGDGPQPLPGEWAQLRQAELERLISRARLVAATALLEAGDWMAAADAASAAAERDPYDEAALRVLLRAYVMGGRVAGALAAYAAARERMADELGIDPSPETAALHTAILRGELTVLARPAPAAARRSAQARSNVVFPMPASPSTTATSVEPARARVAMASSPRLVQSTRLGVRPRISNSSAPISDN